ncbi:MAG TPA: cupin domain-containing protein [Gaiellales bacterium]|nr:cupin domain-containing protein [Gaiellales bacterium]
MSTTAASRVMARGREIELRLWERDPAGERAFEPDEDHEHAVYVQAGALIVSIGAELPIEVHAGDTYVIPTGLGHRTEVLEPAIVVEAISPCDMSY